MLALGEGHLLHSTTMLVRKDDEQIAPVMIHAQFREQAFLSILIRHRTLACRNYHQKLVLSHTACQLREGTKPLHLGGGFRQTTLSAASYLDGHET